MQRQCSTQEVKGLLYLPEIITMEQQQSLIKRIKQQEWNTSLKRRTQHYGYEYSYDRKSKATKTKEIPEWCQQVKKSIEKLLSKNSQRLNTKVDLKVIEFDQLIINQYQPGQGINPHIDNVNLFQDCVVSLSLGSDTLMVFEHEQTKVEVCLKRRSLVVLTGEARYEWKHSIPSRKSDHGKLRSIRYSLTFRKMKENEKE